MANTARNLPGEPTLDTNNEDRVQVLDRVQTSYLANKKQINTALTIVLLGVIGFFGYRQFVQVPNRNKAAAALYYAEKNFQRDSLNLALQGDGNAQHPGLLKLMKKYDGTPAANLSHYYAGVCYLKMGNFPEAIKHLKSFDGNGTTLEYVANGLLGDAYIESGKNSDGISAYQKAIANKDDQALTPMYLFRLASAYEMNKNTDAAKKAYTRIRDEYPQSMQARDIDKYLARLGTLD